MILGKL